MPRNSVQINTITGSKTAENLITLPNQSQVSTALQQREKSCLAIRTNANDATGMPSSHTDVTAHKLQLDRPKQISQEEKTA